MPSRKARQIADAADMIVDGFAVLKDDLGYKIVNLSTGHAVVVSRRYSVLESSMDDIEEVIAIQHLKDNLEFLAA